MKHARVILNERERYSHSHCLMTSTVNSSFQALAARCETPYGQGGASERIATLLETLPLDNVLMKKFHTLEVAS